MNDTAKKEFQKQFTPEEWKWLMADQNCRNVIAGDNVSNANFYCNYRLPRRLRKAKFWKE